MHATTNPPFPLSPLAARDRAFSAPVPLAVLLAPVTKLWSAGSSFVSFLMRIVRVILARVGKAFGVGLQAPGLGVDGAEPPAAASFVSEAHLPDAQQAVERAAQAAASQLSEFLEKVVSQKPVLDKLQGEGAPAYLALVLDELGQSIRSRDAELSELNERVDAGVQVIAATLGVSVQSTRTLIEEGDLPENTALANDDRVKAVLADLSRLQDVRRDSMRMKLSFCDHCIAARGEGAEPELAAIADDKVAAWADEDLTKALENAFSQRHRPKKNEERVNSPQEELGGAVAKPEIIVRRSRAGLSAGNVDAATPPHSADDDGDEHQLPRERMQ